MDTMLRKPTTVGEIISGKRRISIEEAVMLAALFETDSDFWINVQTNHDRWEARQ
ncbi:helix-turn-helix transcriptional regulator [Xenorhabdus hominickii]|uniref:Transcriptional regulator n=1 Tax=Xenorhabdus hominickii TaxID=351679 RepID=A0A2G0Q6Z1_XENHO|nr:hypothetical protein [Xenorhabdus hominickii]PHM54997.1 transcriptional regulator [Xenorhabdus hominickii]